MVTRMQNVESLLGAYTEALTSRTAGPEVVRECRDLLMTYLQAQLGQDRPVIDLDTLVVDPLPLLGTDGVEFPGFLVAHDTAWELVVVHSGRVHASLPQRLKFEHVERHLQRRIANALLHLDLLTSKQHATWEETVRSNRDHARREQFRQQAAVLGIVLTPEQLEKLG